MDKFVLNKRMWSRMDCTTQLTHLTKAHKDMTALDVLFKILIDKQIKPADYKGIVKKDVCCFQEVSLFCLAEHIRYDYYIEGSKERYQPIGIRLDKEKVFNRGGLPVIYSQSPDQDDEPSEYKWRYVRMELWGYFPKDWSHEREWRTPNPVPFDYSEISIVLPGRNVRQNFIERCDKAGRSDIYKTCRSLIVLTDIYD